MRTTYRGTNRAQNIKKMREILAYQQAKSQGKVESLKEKYFSEKPTRLQRVWTSIKAIFSVLLAGVVASTVFLLVLAYFMSGIK